MRGQILFNRETIYRGRALARFNSAEQLGSPSLFSLGVNPLPPDVEIYSQPVP
jgi:hypothetical protein